MINFKEYSRKLRLPVLALVSVVVLTGCFNKNSGVAVNDGGVYKSIDGGQTWTQKVDILATQGRVLRFVNANVEAISMDPSDHNAIYVGTEKDGLFYSYDGGDSWFKSNYFQGLVSDIAVSYFDKCNYMIVQPKKVTRTLDCGRGYRDVLTSDVKDVFYKFVLSDHFNKNTVYVASNKEVLKSNDYGATWLTVGRFKHEIMDIVMDINDSRILYVALDGGGLQKTVDGGQTWTEILEPFKEYKNAAKMTHIVQDKTVPDTYLVVNDYGMFKTRDGGQTWTPINLITSPGTVDILSFDIDPTNGKIIYYGTDDTFYKTYDGGQTWQTSKLPTTRRSNVLLVDFKDPRVIYLGVKYVKK